MQSPGPAARAFLAALDRFSELVDGRLERARLGVFDLEDVVALEHQQEVLFRRANEYDDAVRAGTEAKCPAVLARSDAAKDQWAAAMQEARQLRSEAMA